MRGGRFRLGKSMKETSEAARNVLYLDLVLHLDTNYTYQESLSSAIKIMAFHTLHWFINEVFGEHRHRPHLHYSCRGEWLRQRRRIL